MCMCSSKVQEALSLFRAKEHTFSIDAVKWLL
jgi:hypothetical protein